MFPVELIGKNFSFLTTIRALTHKGFQVLEILHARAMHGGRHGFSPFLWACFTEEFFFSLTTVLRQGFSLKERPALFSRSASVLRETRENQLAELFSDLLAIVLGHLNTASQGSRLEAKRAVSHAHFKDVLHRIVDSIRSLPAPTESAESAPYLSL